MSVGALTSSAAKPDIADLLARARTIAEVARERAQQTETERRVGDDMIERMRQADLFRVMQPRLYGGFEYGFEAGPDGMVNGSAAPCVAPTCVARCGKSAFQSFGLPSNEPNSRDRSG